MTRLLKPRKGKSYCDKAIKYLKDFIFVDFKQIKTPKNCVRQYYSHPIVKLPRTDVEIGFEISQSACAKAMKDCGCSNIYISQRAEKQNHTVTKFFEALKINLDEFFPDEIIII